MAITSEELSEFESMLQLDQLAPGRCSQLLLSELLVWSEVFGYDPFQVAHQIEALEHPNRLSGTKGASEFRRPPLKGLWHKHFFDGRFIGQNLANEWTENRRQKLVEEVLDPAKSPVVTREMVAELAHRLVHGAMETRNQEERLTRKWIVFDIHDGKNYYLCLARHSEGDQAIFTKLTQFVFPEFPFLKAKYGES